MADLTITAANVVKGSDASTKRGIAGETIAQGKAVYLAATGKYMLADADSATALARQATGIALTGSSLNQPIVVQERGDITIGATLTVGAPYYLSGTAGGICPLADVSTGEYYCMLGLAKSTTVLTLNIIFPGVAA